MCNAWNHPAGCTCGWGGDGHLGRSPGGFVTHPLGCFSWQHRDEDFCRPTSCPRCGGAVFFVRHNGGSVWFDELGHPWPKHECFDEDRYGIQLRRLLASTRQVFGVIIETETTRPGVGGRIMVRCCDGTVIDQEFDTKANLSLLLGRLAVVDRGERGELSLRFVNPGPPRRIASWRIVDTRTKSIVEEFAYRRKAEAEQRLLALGAQYPDRYYLEIDKRYEY
jgi:hypothetical protein